jgi:hypothetical protein
MAIESLVLDDHPFLGGMFLALHSQGSDQVTKLLVSLITDNEHESS